eukprot:5455720-Amphidinium_carterae.2
MTETLVIEQIALVREVRRRYAIGRGVNLNKCMFTSRHSNLVLHLLQSYAWKFIEPKGDIH